MGFDGIYKVTIHSPLGDQEGTMTLRTEGEALSGSVAGELGNAEFTGGSVTDDEARWTVEVPGPIGKVKLTCTATLSGDELNGKVKAGFFGSFPMQGKRVQE